MNKLFRLLAQCLNKVESDLTIDTTSDDLDTWDSLSVINIVVALEGEYQITLTAEEVEQLKSVKSVIEILRCHNIDVSS